MKMVDVPATMAPIPSPLAELELRDLKAANLSLRDSYREERAAKITAENAARRLEMEIKDLKTINGVALKTIEDYKRDNQSWIETRNHWWGQEGERIKELRACQSKLEEWKKEVFELRRRLQDEYNKVLYTPVFLQVGQVYMEVDDGAVIEREITQVDNKMVFYVNRQDTRHHDGRRQCSVKIFETLVRARVLVLKTPPPTFDDKGYPTAGFQVGDVWVSTGDGGARVIDKLEDGEITYHHRHTYTSLSGQPKLSVYSNNLTTGGVHPWRGYVGAEAKLLRGRLTDYHCACGSTCYGNETHHWCVNPECKHVGVVCPSKSL